MATVDCKPRERISGLAAGGACPKVQRARCSSVIGIAMAR
jgi:hypothetical protein